MFKNRSGSYKSKFIFLITLVVFSILSILSLYVFAHDIDTPFCTTTGNYNLCSDKDDYSPTQTVHLAGTGFAADTNYQVKVTRPDGTVVTGDGSFALWPTSYDSVIADTNGGFQYDYILDGIIGTYNVEVLDTNDDVVATGSFNDGTSNKITDITQSDLTPDTVIPGLLKVPLMTFTVKTKDTSEHLQKVKVQYTGTNKIDVSSLYLYKESPGNSSGTFDSTTDTKMAADSAPSAGGEFVLDNGTGLLMINGSNYQFYIVADISPSASIGDIVDVQILEDKITFDSGTWPNATGKLLYDPLGNSTIFAKPRLTVNKTLIPSSDLGRFNLMIDGVVNKSNVGNGGTTGPRNVSAGIHIASESAGANATLSDYVTVIGGDCASDGTVSVDAGESKTCTITNIKKANLTVFKIVINNNGGNKVVSDFPLFVDGNFVTSGTFTLLANGTHAVSETNDPGYTATFSGDCNSNGNVVLTPGSNKTCYITNDDIGPKLTVTKIVTNNNGGTKVVSDFPLFVDNVSNQVTSGVQNAFNAGGHTVFETNQPGYSGTISGDCLANGSISLALGDVKQCTITNDDTAPNLTLIKIVVNDDGGNKQVSDFSLFINGNPVASGTPNSLNANVLYTASETSDSGYTASSWSGDCSANGQITLQLGDNKTCTITNDDKPGKIKIIKNTVGGDGTFGFTITGQNSSTPSVTTGSGTGDTGLITVNAGSYSVSETTIPSGWDLTDSSCDSGTPTNFNVPNGGTITCTFTNTKKAHIIIKKNAIPDSSQEFTFDNNFGNGNPDSFSLTDDSTPGLPSQDFEVLPGTYSVSESPVSGWKSPKSAKCSDGSPVSAIVASPGETVTCTFVNEKLTKIILVKNTLGGDGIFDFDATGTGLLNNIELITSGGTANQTFSNLDPDNTYSIAENVPNEWDLTSATCTGTNTPQSITPNAGEVVTCTFTNTKHGHLIVQKTTYPTNDPTEFTISATSSTGGTITGGGAGTVTDATDKDYEVTPGTYSVSETVPDHWMQVSNDCSDVVVGAGETKYCTIVDKKDVHITVTKTTVGDFGTFHFTGLGGQQGFDIATSNGNNPESSFFDVFVNADGTDDFTVTEDVPQGWSVDQGTCSLTDVKPGDTHTCSFTNTKKPKLTVKKVVINHGSDKDATAFVPYKVGDTEVTLEAPTDFNSGTYTVTETIDTAHYTTTFSGDCDSNGQITLNPGDDKTCTITNEEIKPKLTVTKVVINDNGGTKLVEDFPLKVDQSSVTSNVQNEFDSGAHVVSETSDPGYTGTITGDCETDGTITLHSGDVKSCTITNDDNAPSLTLVKVVTNDNGGTATENQWTLTASGPTGFNGLGPSVSNGASFDAGTYTLSESGPSGYTASAWSCVGGSQTDDQITLGLGESATCTITNDDIPGEIHGMKFEDLNGNGIKDQSESGLSGWTIFLDLNDNGQLDIDEPSTVTDVNGSYSFTGLSVGTYHVGEVVQAGWTQTTPNPAPINVGLGDVVNNVDFGNFHQVTITGLKFDDTNANGQKDVSEPGIENWEVALRRVINEPVNNIPIDTELVQLSLTGVNGDFSLTAPTAGHYIVTETPQTGWQQTAPSIDSFFDIFVDLSGEHITTGIPAKTGLPPIVTPQPIPIEFGNFKLAKIIVHKNVLNPDGGEVSDSHVFKVKNNDANEQQISEGSDVSYDNLAPGTYTITENADTDYTLDSITPPVTPTSGSTTDVYVVNKQKKSTITVVKDVRDPNENDLSDDHKFSVTVNGEAKPFKESSSASFTVNPGIYGAVESADPNYELVSNDGPATVGSNGQATITIKNKQKAGSITVYKDVKAPDGQTDVSDNHDFTVKLNGADGHTINEGLQALYGGLAPGTYTISEDSDAGYDLVSISPDNDAQTSGAQVTVLSGQNTDVHIVNKQKPGKITVEKTTVGGIGTFHFTGDHNLDSNGKDVITVTENTPASSFFDVFTDLGSEFTITEDTQQGWDADKATCKVTVNPGQTQTCSFTNTKLPTLTVNKVTDPVDDLGKFNLQIDSVDKATDVSNGGTTGAQIVTVGPHTVSETAGTSTSLSDYTSIVSGDCVANGTITLAAGQNKICTITNTKKAHIIIDKVTNPSGDSQSFTFTTSGSGYNGFSLTDSETPNDQKVVPGTYSVSETPLAGWDLTSATCNSGTQSSINLQPGQTVICTFTNSKKAVISDENAQDISSTSTTIVWTTNVPATSRVVYDIVSHPALGPEPNYGYAFSTIEDGTKVTSHSVIINGLTSGLTYYYRVISKASPESVGGEFSFTTASIITPKAKKQKVLDDMKVLLPTLDKRDTKKMEQVIKHVEKSLDNDLWLDGNHPNPKKGKKIFEEEEQAVEDLRKLIKDKKSNIPDATLLDFANRLLAIDRELAVIAINDAVAGLGKPKDIDKANKELAKGDNELTKKKYEEAIDHYRHAWEDALKSLS